MPHVEFQAPEPSDSEEEDFSVNIFHVFLLFKPRTPCDRAILDPGGTIGTNLVKNHKPMLLTKYQAPEHSSSGEDFKYILFLNPRFVVIVVALLFYVHGKHLMSCRDGQLA